MKNPNIPQVTGAMELARALHEFGVDRVFGVCGDHINAFYNALETFGIKIIGMRTEAAAVQMADGFARASGRLGVATVTGCPGHTNAITGLAVAQSAQSPVLLVSGLTPVTQRERAGQQVMYQAEMVKTMTKWAIEITDAQHMAQYVSRAMTIATEGTPGPVSLSIPVDVLAEKVSHTSLPYRIPATQVQRTASQVLKSDPTIDAAERLLQSAKRPVVVLGAGLRVRSEQAQFEKNIRAMGVPVFTLDQSRGVIPDDGEVGFGYADPLFNPVFREILHADLIILAGARLDFHLCFGSDHLIAPSVHIIQMASDETQLHYGRSADLAILGHVESALLALASSAAGPEALALRKEWLHQLQSKFEQWQSSWVDRLVAIRGDMANNSGVHPLEVCMSLKRHHTDNTAIMIDAGDFVHWARSFFPVKKPGHWMDAVLVGNLGGSIPLGMGAQMALPDSQTWVFVGDGGFGFSGWDLSAAVENNLPVKIIVGNDACWGIEKRLQLHEFGSHQGCELPRIRYDQFAQLLGAKGLFVNSVENLDAAVDELMATPGPCILNVEISAMAGRPINDFPRQLS